MASYKESINALNQEEIVSGYRKLLEDIKFCIDLLEDLESERGLMNLVSDWAMGKRSSLNIYTTRNSLQLLCTEVKKGLTLHRNLFSLIAKAKMIQQTLQLRIYVLEHSGMDPSLLMMSHSIISSTNENFYSVISKAVDIIKETGKFGKQEAKPPIKSTIDDGLLAGGVQQVGTTTTTGALVALTGGIASVGSVFSNVAYSYGKERGVKYQKLQSLSEPLLDTKLLSTFKSHHIHLTEITKGFEDNINLYEREVKRIPSFIPKEKEKTPRLHSV